jgi:predicted extracellular nuclease
VRLILALALAGFGAAAFQVGPSVTPIPAIQGATHLSPWLGRAVVTEGIVTAMDSTTVYLQHPAGDGNAATSDGIAADRPGAPSVAVGDRVRVAATVAEAAAPGSPEGLTTTRLVRLTRLEVLSRGAAAPPPVVIGGAGRSVPRHDIVGPDELPVDLRDTAQARRNPFTPATDALDFFESLEGMRVTLRRPLAISPTERRGRDRADGFVHVDGASTADRHRLTAAGGILLQSGPDNRGDQNPDRVRVVYDPALLRDTAPVLAVGDRLDDVTGVVGYAYGAFQVSATAPVRLVSRSSRRPVAARLVRGDAGWTMASYNVLNLSADSSDDRQRARLASQIVESLGSPDILALQEIQDASGERDDGVVDAAPTLQALARAIVDAGGPRYAYVDVAPVNGRPGGAPGGNIRNAFLYDTARVRLVSHRALTPLVLAAAGAPDSAAFAESRDPLEAVFEIRGRLITAINNHLTSRYGSTPVFGAVQPARQAGEAEREAQVRGLRAYVAAIARRNPDAPIVVLGDMNTFEFTDDLIVLLPGTPPLLTNLALRVAEPERYSYNFEGNSQLLDHIFVTDALAAAEVEVVHLNTDFPSEHPASDHDPLLARFRWE